MYIQIIIMNICHAHLLGKWRQKLDEYEAYMYTNAHSLKFKHVDVE